VAPAAPPVGVGELTECLLIARPCPGERAWVTIASSIGCARHALTGIDPTGAEKNRRSVPAAAVSQRGDLTT